MMRYIISWAASLPNFSLASLNVTAAFLNAPFPTGRIVVFRPPTILYKLNLLPPGHVWLVHKSIYGLREAPSSWSEERTEALTKLTFTFGGELYSLLSQIHRSLCFIVRQRFFTESHSTHGSSSATVWSCCRKWHLLTTSSLVLLLLWSSQPGHFTRNVEIVGSTISDNGHWVAMSRCFD